MGNVREPKNVRTASHTPPSDAGAAAPVTAEQTVVAVAVADDDPARALHRSMIELGRMRSLRDPIAHIISDLTPPQVHTIMWLGIDGSQPLNVVAQRVACTQPTFTGIVDRLERAGLVERERGVEDRRVVRVKLTEAGRTMYAQLDAQMHAQLARLLAMLDLDDRESLIRIMKTLVDRVRQRMHTTPDTP